jgi:hypothetical protein
MLLLLVLAGAMAFLLRETIETERLLSEGFDQVLKTSALAEEFRADVSRAESAPEAWQRYQAGPQTLILRMPGGSHVVYHPYEEGWERRALENGKLTAHNLPLESSDVEMEFVRGARTITIRLHRLLRGRRVPGQAVEIAAALGGDAR